MTTLPAASLAYSQGPRLRRAIGLAAVIAVLFLFVWFQSKLIYLIFAGFLLAVALHSFASWLEHHTPLTHKYSYTVALLAIIGAATALALLIAPRAISESGRIASTIPGAIAKARGYLDQWSWGRYVVHTAQSAMNGATGGSRLTGFALGAIHAAEDLIVILVVGFFGALNPRAYQRSLIRLLPSRYRETAQLTASDVAYTLRWWIIGQLVPMVALGGGAMLGLWLLHVPLAFTLGLMTGLLIFIPYIGALLSEIPAILVALTVSPHTALYVLILYLGVHIIEGYLLTPFVQKRAVRLPPLLTILSQLIMWEIGGLLGVLVATPMAAVGLALVKTLYLHEPVRPGARAASSSRAATSVPSSR
jgi:predicted PurR-regulated permease PerM